MVSEPIKNPDVEPPLITSTFRQKDLIRRVPSFKSARSLKRRSSSEQAIDLVKPSDEEDDGSDGEWEFIPPRIPDGISLRNFGIQVVRLSFPCLN